MNSDQRHGRLYDRAVILCLESRGAQPGGQERAGPAPPHSLEGAEVELVGVVPEEHLAAVVSVSTAGHEVQSRRGRPDDPVLLQPHVPGIQDRLNHELKLRRRETHRGRGD